MNKIMTFLFGNMNDGNGIFKFSVGSLFAFLISALGGWDVALKILITFTCLDIFTGLLSALYNGKASSAIGYKGLIRKIGIYCMVAVSQLLDNYMGTELLRPALIGFYIAMEGLSVLENLGKAGVPMFPVITNALEQLKVRSTKENNK